LNIFFHVFFEVNADTLSYLRNLEELTNEQANCVKLEKRNKNILLRKVNNSKRQR